MSLAHALPLLEKYVADWRKEDTRRYWEDASSDLYNMLEDNLIELLGERIDNPWCDYEITDPAKLEAVDNILAWLTQATTRVRDALWEVLNAS